MVINSTFSISSQMSNRSSSSLSSNGGDPSKMSIEADLAWTIVFTFMIICAMFGNLVVFWIVLAHRRMQNVTNYFLVNLSLADLMMSCLNTIFNFIYMKNRNWIFGSLYCKINNFIAHLSVPVSVFTLVAISIDRYIAIVHPLKQRMSKTIARILLIIIWSGSSLLSLPTLLYSRTVTSRNVTVCFLHWPDGYPTVSKWDYLYNIMYFILTYILPIFLMVVCYGQISGVLWGSKGNKESTATERKLSSKRKLVKMFIVLVIIFAVCWFPYHVYFIYIYHHKDLTKKPFIQHVYLSFYWLAMANSMFNPFIYYWMNATFRGYFKALMASFKVLMLKPRGLWNKSMSKSSLNIGSFPSDPCLYKIQRLNLVHRSPQMNSPGGIEVNPRSNNSSDRSRSNVGAMELASLHPESRSKSNADAESNKKVYQELDSAVKFSQVVRITVPFRNNPHLAELSIGSSSM